MKTVFIRAIEADIDDKAAAIKAAIHAPEQQSGRTRFEVDPASFAVVPKSPFAYWVSDRLRQVFGDLPAFESDGRVAKQGLATADDLRFTRLATEVAPAPQGQRWFPFAKGGKFSPFYADVYLVVDWEDGGHSIKNFMDPRTGRTYSRPQNTDFFRRPGLTWPLRTNGLSLRVMPAGCIFGHKGPAIFVDGDDSSELLALLAITNSCAFNALVSLQLARTELAQSYEVGLIQRTPIPDFRPADEVALASLARRAWSLKRSLDTITETSHAFELPALLVAGVGRQAPGVRLRDAAAAWNVHVADTLAQLDAIQREIDDRCFALYGISEQDRATIELGFGGQEETEEAEEDAEESAPSDPGPLVSQLLSWSVGVAFGRFDTQLSTDERETPAEPEPFDPLPVCSPGMLTGDDGLPPSEPPEGYPIAFPDDGVLVDDVGHPRDLMAASQAVFDVVFDDDDACWHEAAELSGAPKQELRAWFAREFFTGHIKTYSRSRRKAPIYWQLATPSASYSVWCYVHRLSSDTFFRVLNDLIAPKLAHEEDKATRLQTEAGPNPSSKEREAIHIQQRFVDELRSFKVEVARVAPLWHLDLDDGVIINFAPLWRLVPQNKSWQKECKKVWDKLQAGDYDWAHLAMHLWSERVVPRCQEDRSLAIAHGLEDELWFEDDDGKWQRREVSIDRLAKLVAERSSTAVKAALGELLSAPAPSGGGKRRSRKRGGTA